MKHNVVLITGSRKGIGLSLVKYFINSNFKVIGCSRGKSEYHHKNYFFVQCDVTDEVMVKNVIKLGYKKFGSVDILIIMLELHL